MEWVDLSQKTGFQAKLNLETGEIEFAPGINYQSVSRSLKDIINTGVIFEPEKIPENALDKTICRIYRYINDSTVLKAQKLPEGADQGYKYDITVLLPYTSISQKWTGEFPKTTGHYHAPTTNQPLPPPDFYQIIYGQGEIILQKQENYQVRTYRVKPKILEPVLIEPHLGHTTVNTGKIPLIFCNICVRMPHLDYKDVHKYKGAPYYLYRNKNGKVKIIKNPVYEQHGIKVHKLKKLRSSFKSLSKYGITPGKPFYKYILEKRRFNFLLDPKSYLAFFDTVLENK